MKKFFQELNIEHTVLLLLNDNKSAIHVVRTGQSFTAPEEVSCTSESDDEELDPKKRNTQVQSLLQSFQEKTLKNTKENTVTSILKEKAISSQRLNTLSSSREASKNVK